MKFRFRLEKVLELRRSELDRLRMRTGEIEGRRLTAVADLEQAQRQRVEYARHCDQATSRNYRALDLQTRVHTVALHARRIAGLEAALTEIEAELEVARTELLEAHRRVKILERLREKKWAEHLREMNAQEQKVLDDISMRTGSLGSIGSALPARSRR